MQVLFAEEEFAEFQAAAREEGQTLAEWVRQSLRRTMQGKGSGDTQQKLEAIREAAGYDFPTADIDLMIAEIESGYGSGS